MVLAALLALAIVACDVDDPPRLTANQRVVPVVYDSRTALVAAGDLTIEPGGNQITVAVTGLPVLTGPASGQLGWAYEGWISYPDTGESRGYISTGRFRIPATNQDPEFPTGVARFTYMRSGGFELLSTGMPLAQGQPMPDTLDFTDGVTFLLAIEQDPDPDPNTVGYSHILVSNGDLPAVADTTVTVIMPLNVGTPEAGDFSTLDGEALLNAATGEFQLQFQRMPYFTRSSPPADPGLIYQAWFVDDDTSPPRYLSIARFNPNIVGDATLTGAVNPGDSDGDGLPEPLDLERVMISIEPDMLNAQQPPGQGVDTDGAIFQLVPYRATLPDVMP